MPLSTPIIEGFIYDEINEEEMAKHGLTARQVDQILENKWAWFPNRRNRTGEYLIVGIDSGGTIISTPISEVSGYKPLETSDSLALKEG